MTSSQLFAGYTPAGDHKCYYCGGACGNEYLSKTYVKATFTNRDIVSRPSSPYVCRGCMETLRSDLEQIIMIDGEIRGKDATYERYEKPQRVRMYSWVITSYGPVAATKSHIAHLRGIVLDPPDPPFVIALATSGQKNLLFRAPVAWDRNQYPLMFEEEVIDVDTHLFAERIEMVKRVIAVVGKPGSVEPMTMNMAIACEKYYGNLDVLEEWELVRPEPLSRLAAWLAPNKEDSRNEYPGIERGDIPPETGWAGRRKSKATGNGTGSNQGHGDSLHLDFGKPV